MRNLFKETLSVVAISVMLTSCANEFDKAPSIEFNDTILRHNFTDNYGLATGLLNIYIMYGQYQLVDKNIPAGICLTPQGFKKFRIRQVLDKYPELNVFATEEAARRQDFKR